MPYKGDTKRMATLVKNILLGCLEMWIFAIRIVFTAWCVTIGVFWSITVGTFVELTNNDKANVGVSRKKSITDGASPNTRKPHARNDHGIAITFNSKIKMCNSHSRHSDNNSKRLTKTDDAFSRSYIPILCTHGYLKLILSPVTRKYIVENM